MTFNARSNLVFISVVWAVGLIASGIAPYERITWVLEVAPVIIGYAVLLTTFRHYPLTTLLYGLIALHGLVLILGGHYTYARVPAGFWVQDLFDLSRNHYDRLGHFFQGFVPAIIAREVLLRKTALIPGKMLFFIVASICLAFSAFYELIEWFAAVILGADADAFLGTQGDPWDTQWDMWMALLGAVSAQLFLARLHDRAMTAVPRWKGA